MTSGLKEGTYRACLAVGRLGKGDDGGSGGGGGCGGERGSQHHGGEGGGGGGGLSAGQGELALVDEGGGVRSHLTQRW